MGLSVEKSRYDDKDHFTLRMDSLTLGVFSSPEKIADIFHDYKKFKPQVLSSMPYYHGLSEAEIRTIEHVRNKPLSKLEIL